MQRLSVRQLVPGVAVVLAVVMTGAVGDLGVAGAAAATPPTVQARNPATVTSDALPTVQIDDGVVWSQVVVGNTVYAGGSFSNARPPGAAKGSSLSPRANLLAYDVTTGTLLPFAPSLNGVVKSLAVSPDRTRLYVGGSFGTVNSQAHYELAAFDLSTGALISTFKAQIGGSYVNAIAATNSAVYVGGLFTQVNGLPRKNLAAFDLTGKPLSWAPTTDLQVDAMVMTPALDKVIVGGRFSTVNGTPQRGLVALSPSTGSKLSWAAPNTVVDGDSSGHAGIYSLSADSTTVYGTGWVYANATVGNLEGSFAADPGTGAIKWIEDCHGDTYSSYSDNTNVYVVGHPHDCSGVGGYPQADPAPGNVRHALAFTASVQGTLTHSDIVNTTYKDWYGSPAPALINWFPDMDTGQFTGQGQAAWSLAGNGRYVVAGGEFPTVNNKAQYGLTRFAVPSISGAKDGPRLSAARWTPTAASPTSGQVRVTIAENYDRDDRDLTYKLYRSGVASPVYTVVSTSLFWTRTKTVSFLDTGLAPGSYTYQWTATDSNGTIAKSAAVTLAANGGATTTIAADTFTRSVAGGWGVADSGGAWTVSGSTTAYSVGNSVGQISVPAGGGTRGGTLGSVSARDVSGSVDVSFGSAPPTAGFSAWLAVRSTSNGEYRLVAKVTPTATTVSLRKVVGTTTTVIASKSVSLTYAAGDRLRMAIVATATGTTLLSGKVWKLGTAEPTAYQVTGTDTEASLQGPGNVGVRVSVPTTQPTPVTSTIDNVSITAAA